MWLKIVPLGHPGHPSLPPRPCLFSPYYISTPPGDFPNVLMKNSVRFLSDNRRGVNRGGLEWYTPEYFTPWPSHTWFDTVTHFSSKVYKLPPTTHTAQNTSPDLVTVDFSLTIFYWTLAAGRGRRINVKKKLSLTRLTFCFLEQESNVWKNGADTIKIR